MRKREAQALSEILGDSLKNLQIDGKINETRVKAAWPEMVGPILASHTQSTYVSRKILYVRIDTPIIRNELQLMRQSLLERLNKAAGAETIKDIVFR
jgi:predicted nucleic acid-binding Zn ribbon protein